MSRLATVVSTGDADNATPRASVMTPERWLGVYVVGALIFLVAARAAFRDFIPT